jgi:hypothetical protein
MEEWSILFEVRKSLIVTIRRFILLSFVLSAEYAGPQQAWEKVGTNPQGVFARPR